MPAVPTVGGNPVGGLSSDWLARYKEDHHAELAGDEEFARWLEEDYAPIAGGWHY
jgi:hypothetical protein